MAATQRAYRFTIGDRVSCNVGKGWRSGVVVALDYREPDWPPGKVAPYQVELDERHGGDLIYAPADSPHLVRSAQDAPLATPSLPAAGDAAAALRAVAGELPAVRALPFVVSADPPRLLGCAEHEGKLIVPAEESGPWVLPVLLRGPEGTAYAADYQVHVKFNSAWPKNPAEVRFCGVIHHPLIDGIVDPGALRAAALRLPAADHSGQSESDCSGPLCAALRAAHAVLQVGLEDDAGGLVELNAERLRVIEAYRPLRRHRRLYDTEAGLCREWLDPACAAALADGSAAAWRGLVKTEGREVYSFPLFTPEFCDTFVEELYSFYASKLPAKRPNSMNNYGVIVNDIGMEPMLDVLQREVLAPLSAAFYPGIGSNLDHHHSFVVRYKMGEDLGLDMHTDDSDVTFNCCMGRQFQGAGLQFCGDLGMPDHRAATLLYQHQKGRCVFHLGRRRHGADDITDGERLNLIIWNHNSEYRRTRESAMRGMQKHYRREAAPPDPVCVSYTHDRDYGVFQAHTERTRRYRGRGWCPPPHAEYDGFKAEECQG
eukprot:TRINITY_DN10087_c0_g1_i1.p1 TRINITY_DN10087_c0_g1~~TRINITY_DN10087_c0_g1_i1.p1  ORF type:complete len:572 (+),score=182.14 TRINITY_DN10087_c0_g1_i1:89-1717(+)